MNNTIGIFIMLLFVVVGYSQNDTATIYVDFNRKEVSKDKAKYISKQFNKDEKWVVNNYYLSGELQMKGACKSKKYIKRHGAFTYYYKNGNLKSKGNYKNNKKDGNWISWEQTGKIHEKGEYKKGEFDGIIYWYYEDLLCSEEKYKDDKMVKYTFYDEEGNKLPENTTYEQKPEYPGGINNLLTYIKESVNYPIEAENNKIESRVLVEFVINKQGEVTNVKVKNNVNELLEKEAIRVIENMQNWKPGKQRNRPVNVMYTVPINFTF